MGKPQPKIPGLARTREQLIKGAMDRGATYREARKLVDPGLSQYAERVRRGDEPPPKKRD